MFEWLTKLIEEIKTPRFFVIGIRGTESKLEPTLPLDYRSFINQFGGAKLFRLTRSDTYRILIHPEPVKVSSSPDRLWIGTYEDTRVFLKRDALGSKWMLGGHAEGQDIDLGPDSFEAWLKLACTRAQRQYTTSLWKHLQEGPDPFTAAEVEIVKARGRYAWATKGVNQHGQLLVEVTNLSNRVLPFITVGIRDRTDLRRRGTIYLVTKTLKPGETAVQARDGCKDWYRWDRDELFQLPDPQPEDRAHYWEFKPFP